MAKKGDQYIVQLKLPHLKWGIYRKPTNRDPVEGEGYIPIPQQFAILYNIFNSNHKPEGFGYNLFYANSSDGFLKNVVLLAQGSSNAGDIYAKQFSVQGNLQRIGSWYKYCNAGINNSVRVLWISFDSVLLEII